MKPVPSHARCFSYLSGSFAENALRVKYLPYGHPLHCCCGGGGGGPSRLSTDEQKEALLLLLPLLRCCVPPRPP